MTDSKYTTVVDLGKRRDRGGFFTWKETEGIIDGKTLPTWVIVHLDLFQKVSYHDMVRDLVILMSLPELEGEGCDLLVDGLNVGEAVLEIMRANTLSPISIITTGGQTVREVRKPFGQTFGREHGAIQPLGTFDEVNVPKTDLVTSGRHLAQRKRVTLAEDLQWAGEFRKQMRGFHGFKSTRSSQMKYEADTDLIHDDFVWCYLAAAWWCTRGRIEDDTEEEVGSYVLNGFDPLEEM